MLTILSTTCASAHRVYTDISLAYYTHFITAADSHVTRHENFQRYHQIKQALSCDDTTLAFNFDLYEAVDGPMADHTITPYTLELKTGNLEATGLVLVDVYDKAHSYLTSVVDVRYHWQMPIGDWSLDLIPRFNAVHHKDSWSWSLSSPWLGARLQRSFGLTQVSLGINTLDAKDTLLLADETYVVTGKVAWPTWGKNHTAIGVNWRPAGSSTKAGHLWFDIRVYFDHWFCVDFDSKTGSE